MPGFIPNNFVRRNAAALADPGSGSAMHVAAGSAVSRAVTCSARPRFVEEVRVCGPDQPGVLPVPLTSTGQALAALHGALTYLATADAAALTTAEQADCLRELERAESVRVAARSAVLTAFGAGCGFADDGHGTERSWLRWQARITSSAAGAAVAWARRLAAHPAVRDELARGTVSASWAREICDWTDQLPESARADADAILLAAAAAGAELADLAGLAEEIRTRTARPDPDDGDDGF